MKGKTSHSREEKALSYRQIKYGTYALALTSATCRRMSNSFEILPLLNIIFAIAFTATDGVRQREF